MLQRWLALTTAGLLIFCILSSFFEARAMGCNSDIVQIFNELYAVTSGNVLLHGWYLSTDNFYLTDLPFYVLARLVFGMSTALIFIVPWLVFLLFLAACICIIRHEGATPAQKNRGTIAILVLIGLPFASAQALMLQSAVHGATIALSVCAVALAQRICAASRGRWTLLAPYALIILAIAEADPLADAFLIAPALLLVPMRAWLYGRLVRREWAVFGATLIGGAVGTGLMILLPAHGGFQLMKDYATGFVPTPADAVGNARALITALQLTFDAHPHELQGLVGYRSIAITRLITLAGVLLLCLRTLWRAPRAKDDITVQLLLLGSAILAAADIMGEIFKEIVAASAPGLPVFAVRYMFPIYVYLSLVAVISGQQFFEKLRAPVMRRGAAAIMGAFAAVFLVAAVQAADIAAKRPVFVNKAPQRLLAIWLRDRGFTYGAGEYWTARMTTAYGQGKLDLDPMVVNGGHLVPFFWNTDGANFTARRRPQFFVFQQGNPFGDSPAVIAATYGTPREIDQVGNYKVAVLPP